MSASPTPSGPLTDADIAEHIQRYQQRREDTDDALTPVVNHFWPRIERKARTFSVTTHGRVDPADLEAAGFGALFDAVHEFSPARGVPFGVFFAAHHTAALNDAIHTLSSPLGTTRKIWQDRGLVLRAATAVNRERTAARVTPAGPGPQVARPSVPPFQLPPAIDDECLGTLRTTAPTTRQAVMQHILGAIDLHLAHAMPERTAADRALVSVQQFRHALFAGPPRDRKALEETLAARLSCIAAVEQSPHAAAWDETFWQEVGRRAGVSPPQAKRLMYAAPEGVSLDAPPAEHDDGRATPLLERLGHDSSGTLNTTQRAAAAERLSFARPTERVVLTLATGLDGDPPLTMPELAEALGLSSGSIARLMRHGKVMVQAPAVEMFVRGVPPSVAGPRWTWQDDHTRAAEAWLAERRVRSTTQNDSLDRDSLTGSTFVQPSQPNRAPQVQSAQITLF